MLADHLSLLSLIACNNLIIVSRSNHNDTFMNSHNLSFIHYIFHFLWELASYKGTTLNAKFIFHGFNAL